MHVIRDPIHGLIKIAEKEKKIIDNQLFQRLRRIKQLSVEYLIYPAATHTRFEHSLGTMELAGRMASVLEMNVENARLAGLLHDIGHVAFSHSGEKILPYFGFKNHEELGKELLDALGIEIGEEAYLVNFDYGADRMDYLVRDAYHTGTAYGIIEYDTIIRNLVAKEGKIAVHEKALKAVELLLIGRYMMRKAVYQHKTKICAEVMLQEMLKQAYEEGTLDLEDLIWLGDDALLIKIAREGKKSKRWALRILERKLLKVLAVCETPPETDEFFVYEAKGRADFRSWILTEREELKRITEISELARVLQGAEEKSVYYIIGDRTAENLKKVKQLVADS